ncbi:trk system potassium uptake protein TrkH [Natronoarchaeum philippinense]|uniref:Trk system potassium uptake protein TrkH n=1 Tax=Natronoarchaeum philippinense TaxID=558529 RepID=A0A285N932_NATPI|nr:TrkH family potassium uptake protein [Natronoarchaeum philippinense]SNZ04466.1 trk system potassium uptake protein TrkH [Natronoarchaeum philippinense]
MPSHVDSRSAFSLVGTVLKYISVPFAVPLVAALWYGEDPLPFVAAILVTLGVGAGLERLHPDPDLGHREGFLLVGATWLAVPLVGTIPYLVAGEGTVAQPVYALFESMSGFTTTGATVLGDISVERHGYAMMLYRQLTQWLGGMGIVVLMVAILPELSVGGAQLIKEEAPGFELERLKPRITSTARVLWTIYAGATVLAAAVYYGLHLVGVADEMTLYNAVAHALTTMPTGGFSPEARSAEVFSPAIQWAMILFMIVAGTNFALLWHALDGEPGELFGDSEFRTYLTALGGVGTLIAALLFTGTGIDVTPDRVAPIVGAIEPALRQAVFQVVAIVTTTGYASMDFNAWSAPAQTILLFAMFLGGSVGSAAGGIKIVRWYVIYRLVDREVYTTVHPEAVRPIRVSGSVVEEDTVKGLVGFTLLFLLLFAFSTVLLYLDTLRTAELTLNGLEAMSVTMATLGNIGPGFGPVGPMDSYAKFSAAGKLYMVFLMWIGRLEIISVLVLLTPTFWRR